MIKIDQKVATRAFIIHNNKVLILREANTYTSGTQIGKWDLPGGQIEPGETLFDGLNREVHEECGLSVTAKRILHVGEWNPVVNDIQLQIFGIFFVCIPEASDVVLSQDHDTFMWIDPNDHNSHELIAEVHTAFDTYLHSLSK